MFRAAFECCRYFKILSFFQIVAFVNMQLINNLLEEYYRAIQTNTENISV